MSEVEKQIENKVCKYAKNKGMLVYKFSSPNNRGVPDRIFIYNNKCFFIEFKGTNGKLSELQKIKIKEISEQGIDVFVVNSSVLGFEIIDREVLNVRKKCN